MLGQRIGHGPFSRGGRVDLDVMVFAVRGACSMSMYRRSMLLNPDSLQSFEALHPPPNHESAGSGLLETFR
jgi:hypothetical protein